MLEYTKKETFIINDKMLEYTNKKTFLISL